MAIRFFSGATQRCGNRFAPASAPQIEPTVAPTESVSQPPMTAAQIAVSKSPSLTVRAYAASAALLRTCARCRCP